MKGPLIHQIKKPAIKVTRLLPFAPPPRCQTLPAGTQYPNQVPFLIESVHPSITYYYLSWCVCQQLHNQTSFTLVKKTPTKS